MLENILDKPLGGWLHEGACRSTIALSSRVRLARNLKDMLFPSRGNEESLKKTEILMRGVLPDLKKADGYEYSNINLAQLSDTERAVLVEKHILSPVMGERKPHRSLIVSADAGVAVMVNEEDHLRIQSMAPCENLEAAYERAKKIDDAIENKVDYAFNEAFGYLTACPTNTGTGMRASVMLHLPALVMTGRFKRIVRGIMGLGYSVRGLYGEGSQGLGNVFQVSNQLTMGVSEETTIRQLKQVVDGLIREEEQSRTQLVKEDADGLADRVWRSYGTLSYARRIDGEEALSLISDVQLGSDCEILPKVSNRLFDELLVITRPNFLNKYAGREDMTPRERDAYRANVVRDRLKESEG